MCDLKLVIPQIREFSKSIMGNAFHHGWPHILRVLNIAREIHKTEGGDFDVIEVAVLLHDIGRNIEHSLNEHHALLSARISKSYLKKLGVCEKHSNAVSHIIMSHSFSLGVVPRTIEAKILSDADKIDALGAVGVIRAFLFGETTMRTVNETLNHFIEKLFKLPDLMYTETGRRIAHNRLKVMQIFYDSIKKEI